MPQTIEKVIDLSAAIEQSNTAATKNTAQRTKDSAISEQTVTDENAQLSAVVEYVVKLNDPLRTAVGARRKNR